MYVLDSVNCADTFKDPGANVATLGPILGGSNGGYFAVTANDVYCQLAYGTGKGPGGYGSWEWTDAVHVAPGNGILQAGTLGVRFKNYTAGSVAVVSAGLATLAEPALFLSAAGVAASSSSVTGTTPVTTLPGSPADGTIVILVDSLTAPTYAWQLQYSAVVAAAGGRPWLFIGGKPATIWVVTSENLSAASGVWGAFPTDTRFVLPRDGTYRFRFGGSSGGNASASTSQLGVSWNGGTVPIGSPALVVQANNTTVGAGASEIVNTNLAGGSNVGIWGQDSDSTRRIAWSQRWLEITPDGLS